MVKNRRSITAIGVVFLCAAWLQPNHFLPWLSFHSESLAFMAFAILFAIALADRTYLRMLEIPGVAAPMLLLLGVVLLQAALGITDYSGDSIVLAIYILAMVFAATVGRLWVGNGRTHQLSWGILFAGVLSVVIASLQTIHSTEQYTLVNPMPTWRRPGANLAQPNHLGTLLLWAIASAMYLRTLRKISWHLACLLGIVLLLGIAMTESRTALLGVLALAVWSGAKYFSGTNLRRCAMTLGFAATGALLFVLWPIFSAGYQEAGGGGGNTGINTQAGERYVVWPQMLAAAMERPWLGWGARGVSVAHNAVLDRYEIGAPFTYAHNIILDLAIGLGVPMTLLLISLTAVWGLRRATQVRNTSDWYAIALLIPFGLHSMLEFPYAYAYFLLPACFAMGMLDAGRTNIGVMRLPLRGVVAILAGWTLVASVVIRDYLLAEEDFRVARFEALKVGQTPSSYERPQLLLLGQLDAMSSAIRVAPEPNMSAVEIELLRKAALHYPWTAVQYRYALALALNRNQPEAYRQLKVIRAMHGEKMYTAILAQWRGWADTKYPELQGMVFP